jgi:ankyrin repeat protein
MNDELLDYAASGDLQGVKRLVEGGADMEETDNIGRTALSWACLNGHFEIVEYLVEHGADLAHSDEVGMTALHQACGGGHLSSVKYLLGRGVRITERDNEGMTGLLYAAEMGSFEVIQYLLSPEGGASITEADDSGNTALLRAAICQCVPSVVQWLFEYGGAQITDTNKEGDSVWSGYWKGFAHLLRGAYRKNDYNGCVFIDGDYVENVDIVALTALLRVMLLHGGPPESLTKMLPQLWDLVHGYEEPTTTDELWATGLGAPLRRAKRSRPERGQSPGRRSRLHQKRL